MAVYQLRLSRGFRLREWIRHLALQLEPRIPPFLWPPLYPDRGVRVLLLSKALRAGFLHRLAAFEFCGSQSQCDEACVPVERHPERERYLEGRGLVPVERYQVLARSPTELSRELLLQVLLRVPEAASLSKMLLRELNAEVTRHLFTNELCGRTDLCRLSASRDLSREAARDPGEDEAEP